MKVLAATILSLVAIGSGGCESKDVRSLAGRYVLVQGGYSERLMLDLKGDRTYALWHAVDFHEISGEDRGSWTIDAEVIYLSPKMHGAADGEMFLPFHCSKLRVENRGTDLLLVSESVPAIPAGTRMRAVLMKQRPNQSVQPMPGSVTPRAIE